MISVAGCHPLFLRRGIMAPAVTFRPIRDEDQEFLYRVYAGTRGEEMAMAPWTAAEKEKFLRMQFAAQHAHYQEHCAGASFEIVILDGEPIGRLYLERGEDEHRIVDIALLTEWRGKGIGGRIMRDCLAEAAAAGKPVRIHVLNHNRAMHLYNRLGFKKIGDTGVYALMEWTPASP